MRLNRRLKARDGNSHKFPGAAHDAETADTVLTLFYSARVLGTPRCHLSPAKPFLLNTRFYKPNDIMSNLHRMFTYWLG